MITRFLYPQTRAFDLLKGEPLAQLVHIAMGVNDIFSRTSDSNLHNIKLRAKASHTAARPPPRISLPFSPLPSAPSRPPLIWLG